MKERERDGREERERMGKEAERVRDKIQTNLSQEEATIIGPANTGKSSLTTCSPRLLTLR